MSTHYIIQINISPEVFKESPMYFWCIIKNTNGLESNNGHGWSNSIQTASLDAYEYYQKDICPEL